MTRLKGHSIWARAIPSAGKRKRTVIPASEGKDGIPGRGRFGGQPSAGGGLECLRMACREEREAFRGQSRGGSVVREPSYGAVAAGGRPGYGPGHRSRVWVRSLSGLLLRTPVSAKARLSQRSNKAVAEDCYKWVEKRCMNSTILAAVLCNSVKRVIRSAPSRAGT